MVFLFQDTICKCCALVVLTFAGIKTFLKGLSYLEKEKKMLGNISNTLLELDKTPSDRMSEVSSLEVIQQPKKVIGVIFTVWAVYAATFLSATAFERCKYQIQNSTNNIKNIFKGRGIVGSAPYWVMFLLSYIPLVICIYWGLLRVQV